MVPRSCYYWLITLWVSLSLKGRITILKYIQNSLLNFWQLSLVLGKFAEKDVIYFYSKFGDFQLSGKNAFHVFQVEGHHSQSKKGQARKFAGSNWFCWEHFFTYKQNSLYYKTVKPKHQHLMKLWIQLKTRLIVCSSILCSKTF